jgi:hypothetical protein
VCVCVCVCVYIYIHTHHVSVVCFVHHQVEITMTYREIYTEMEVLSSQVFHISKYKNIKKKLLKCNSNICLNKQCLKASTPVFFLFYVIVISN